MSRWMLAIMVAACALLAVPAALGDSSFTDPTGDNGQAPDIVQVVASNDSAGVITFRVTLAAPLTGDAVVFIDIDADGNPGTGGMGGAEYFLGGALGGFGIEKWDGSTFNRTTAASLTMTISGPVVEFKIGKQDIGNPGRFGFDAEAVLYGDDNSYIGEDDAPDGGRYAYVMTYPQCTNGTDDDGDGKVDGQDLGCSSPTDNLESDDPVNLRAGKATVTPATPHVGQIVVVSAPVTRVETGLGVTSGTATCVARIGTQTLRTAGRVGTGRASCSFKMPVAAKGKKVAGTITVTVLGHSTTAPFAFKVS